MAKFRVTIYTILLSVVAHGFYISNYVRGGAKTAFSAIGVRRALSMGNTDGIEREKSSHKEN